MWPDPYENGVAEFSNGSVIVFNSLLVTLAASNREKITMINNSEPIQQKQVVTGNTRIVLYKRCHLPVVIIADLIAALLQVGCMALRRAAIPETWGHDIDVPDRKVNLSLGD